MVYAVLNDARNPDEVNASENSEQERQTQQKQQKQQKQPKQQGDVDQDDHSSTKRTANLPEHSIKHKWLLFFSSIYIFTFAGAMWGFGPMQLLLEEHGAFHSLCPPSDYDAGAGGDYNGGEINQDPDNPHNVCPEQAAMLISA